MTCKTTISRKSSKLNDLREKGGREGEGGSTGVQTGDMPDILNRGHS